mgnify:CR=1 FL=1
MEGASNIVELSGGAGLWVGWGQAAGGFAGVLGAVARRVSPAKRSMALGITTAGGSFGQFYMAPLCVVLIEATGWSTALSYIIGLAFIMIALAAAFTASSSVLIDGDSSQTLRNALRRLKQRRLRKA